MYPKRTTGFSERALDWLGSVQITSAKEASQIAKALCLWGRDARKAIEWLQHARRLLGIRQSSAVTAPTYDSGTPTVLSP
jgi:hypothetical protein